jgi:NAD(P)-dependent dehydrogenase (short-subunit alcohol dehydrogenase family)
MFKMQLLNFVAPFVLCNCLSEIMKKEPAEQKHIINLSAMDGKLHTFHIEDRHPHTNTAKAALNMLMNTAGRTLAKDGIYRNAVVTDWVTDEDAVQLSKKKQEIRDLLLPLNLVDGVAIVIHRLLDEINTGKHRCWKF